VEAVQIEFDPNEISYPELLEVFWQTHNPTEINRQGPDVGSQYQAAIFYHDGGAKAARGRIATTTVRTIMATFPLFSFIIFKTAKLKLTLI